MYLYNPEIGQGIQEIAMLYLGKNPKESRGDFAEQVMLFTAELNYKLAKDPLLGEVEAQALTSIVAALVNLAYIPEPYSHDEANIVLASLMTNFLPQMRY